MDMTEEACPSYDRLYG